MSLRDKILKKGVPGIKGIKPIHPAERKCTKTVTKLGRPRYICPPSGGKEAVRSLENLPVKPEDVPRKLHEISTLAPEQKFTPKQQREEPEKIKEALFRAPKTLHLKETTEAGPDKVQDNLHFKEPEEAGPDKVHDHLHLKEPKEAGPKKGTKDSKKKSDKEEDVEKSLFLGMDIYKASPGGTQYLVIDMETPIDKISDLSQIIPVAKRSSKRLVGAEKVKEMAAAGKIKGHFAVLPAAKAKKLGLLKSFSESLTKGLPALALAPSAAAGIAQGLAFAGAMVGSALLVGAGASEAMRRKSAAVRKKAPASTAKRAAGAAMTATAATATAAPKIGTTSKTESPTKSKAVPTATTSAPTRPGAGKPSDKKDKKSTRKPGRKGGIAAALTAASFLGDEESPKKPTPPKGDARPAAKRAPFSEAKAPPQGEKSKAGANLESAISQAKKDRDRHKFERGAYSDIGGKKRKFKFHQRKDMNKSASFVAPFARQVLNKKMSLVDALDRVPWHMQDDLLLYLRNKKKKR